MGILVAEISRKDSMKYICPSCKKKTEVISLNTWRGDSEIKCMKCGVELPEKVWLKINKG